MSLPLLPLNSPLNASQSHLIERLAGFDRVEEGTPKRVPLNQPGGCGGIERLGSSTAKVRGFLRGAVPLNCPLKRDFLGRICGDDREAAPQPGMSLSIAPRLADRPRCCRPGPTRQPLI